MALQVLCLHGRRQTGNIFEKRLDTNLRRLRTQSRLTLEYTFLDAPFLEPNANEGQLTWWRDSSDTNTYPEDLQTSLNLLSKTLATQGFHFIFSFSQGCALLAEAAAAGILDEHSSLQCIVFAGGLLPSQFTLPELPMLTNIQTLHFAGTKDEAVTIATSQQLANIFVNAEFVIHQQGHSFPSRATESQRLIKFLETHYKDKSFVPSEELLEELEALQYIFSPEEYSIVNETTKRLSVKVSHDQRIIELMFGFTSGYPEELKSIHLTTGDLINCTKTTVRNVLKIAQTTILENPNEPQVFSIVQAVRDYLEEERIDEHENGGKGENEDEDDSKEDIEKNPILNQTNGMIDQELLSELTIDAAQILKTRLNDTKGIMKPRRRKSMYWGNFTIGLVGKPSAGKSTFFNAVKTIGTNAARVGNFPFTTIDPQIGRAAVRFTWPDVIQTVQTVQKKKNKEDVEEVGGEGETVDDVEDNRIFEMEVYVKDVAGLVRGAYQGRGHGNKFLDDLCSADCLIHVLDGSGDTDEEGVSKMGTGKKVFFLQE